MMNDRRAVLLHLRVGAAALFAFAVLGVALESLHAWKAAWYLGGAGETRRFLFTLAHAHGIGLGLVNLALAAALPHLPARLPGVASSSLVAGTLLVPFGFLLGGAYAHGGDPGMGALLVPVGALLVIVALGLLLRAACARAS